MQSDKNCDTMVLGDLERGEDSVREEKKNDVRNSVVRLMISILGFMVQTLWFVMLIYNVNEYSEQIELFTKLVTVVLVMMLYVNDDLNTNSHDPLEKEVHEVLIFNPAPMRAFYREGTTEVELLGGEQKDGVWLHDIVSFGTMLRKLKGDL